MIKTAYKEARAVADLLSPTMSLFSRLMQQGNVVPAGLTPQQVKIILELSIAGPVRLSDLSKCACVTHGTMTVAVQKMLKKGLLIKQKDPSDERAVRLHLSPKGKAISEQIHQKIIGLFDYICAQLNSSQRKKLVESYKFLFETYQELVQKKGL